MALSEPRIEVVEGRRTKIVPTGSGLPKKLPQLLNELVSVTFRADIRPAGARPACDTLRTHRLVRFREGRWFARSGVRVGQVLDLRLRMCADCGAVEVRDVSYDRLGGQARPAAGPPQRRDHVMDWYSGARPAGREYR